MKQVTIIYHGHACFTLEAEGYRTVLDPYKDGMVDGLPDLSLEAEAVYASHHHADHDYVQAVALKETDQKPPYSMEVVETFHDDQGGSLRGTNLVRIFDFDGLKIAHLGDLGHIPTEEQVQTLQGLDCVLIPVGGTFTLDHIQAKQVIELLRPKMAVPMHYRTDSTGFGVLVHLNDFLRQYQDYASCDNTLVLTGQAEHPIHVINYKP